MDILKRLNTYLMEANNRIGQTILKQIKSLDKWALDSWGAKNFVSFDKGIQFDVRGSKFKGRVVIYLNKASDTYTIQFGKIYKLDWKPQKMVKDIHAESLVKIIDDYVG